MKKQNVQSKANEMNSGSALLLGPKNPNTYWAHRSPRDDGRRDIIGRIFGGIWGFEDRKISPLNGSFNDGDVVVEARGFEPPTPASRTQCATGLRYASK